MRTVPTRLRTALWQHQEEGVAFALERKGAVWECGMGSGKSLMAVAVAVRSEARFVLVLCPATATGVWLREFDTHSEGFRVFVFGKGDTAKRAKGIVQALKLARARGEACVVVVNHEASWRDPLGHVLRNFPWHLFIIDESHRLKSPTGRASKHAAKIRIMSRRRLALTGTLTPHSPLDLWAQFQAVDPTVFQPTFTEFKARYGVTAKEAAASGNEEIKRQLEAVKVKAEVDPKQQKLYGVLAEKVVDYRNVEEMRSKYRSITFTRTTEECVDLPPLVEQEVEVELSPKALSLYGQLEKKLYAQVDSGEVTAANALVKLLRLQQLASGVATYDDGRVERVCSAKIEALADIVEDAPRDRPVVVFSRFSPDVEATVELGAKLGLRTGEVSGRRRDLTEHAKIPPGMQLMAVQIQSGGTGVDLTESAICVYLSRGMNRGDYEQSRFRLHRPGQRSKVMFWHIHSAPIDFKVARAMRLQLDVVKAVLDDRGSGRELASSQARKVA